MKDFKSILIGFICLFIGCSIPYESTAPRNRKSEVIGHWVWSPPYATRYPFLPERPFLAYILHENYSMTGDFTATYLTAPNENKVFIASGSWEALNSDEKAISRQFDSCLKYPNIVLDTIPFQSTCPPNDTVILEFIDGDWLRYDSIYLGPTVQIWRKNY